MRPFLDHYLDPIPIRSRGAFHLVAVRRASDGERAVLVLPGTTADTALVAIALAEIQRTHALLHHPSIPRPVRLEKDHTTPYLELACDAVTDAIEVIRMLPDVEEKIPYAAADAFIAGLREAMQAAHAVQSPRDGQPICLGRMSPGNVLFSARGRTWLVGFGRNFPTEKEDGSIDGSASLFCAPELSTGGSPSPSGDYVALLLFMRSVMPYVDMSGPVGRVLRGDIRPSDAPIIETLLWIEQNMVGQIPPWRATIAEAVAAADRLRALLGTTPDPAGFEAFIARLLKGFERGARLDGRRPPAPLTIVLGPEAEWMACPSGVRHRLGRAHRRIITALTERHAQAKGSSLTLWDLLEAGWPGERPVIEAGANRVYVALTHLRRMGLRHVIERTEEGYRLAPRAIVKTIA